MEDQDEKWSLLPLEGKYYGTVVAFEGWEVFKIWEPDHTASPFASEREIELGWEPVDGHDHVEDAQSYNIAKNIVTYMNKIGMIIK